MSFPWVSAVKDLICGESVGGDGVSSVEMSVGADVGDEGETGVGVRRVITVGVLVSKGLMAVVGDVLDLVTTIEGWVAAGDTVSVQLVNRNKPPIAITKNIVLIIFIGIGISLRFT